MKTRFQFAAKMAGAHLLLSALVAAITAFVVLKIWYPHPYGVVLGGLGLYTLVIAIDVVCGPLLTLILADPKKSRRATIQDLVLVAIIQLGALGYGLYTVAIARPVAVVFEADRFVAISAVDIRPNRLAETQGEMRHLSWTGARRVALREPANVEESNLLLDLSLAGEERSTMPAWWQADSPQAREKIQAKMKPIAQLQAAYPNHPELNQAIAQSGLPEDQLFFLPFTSALNKEWTVLLNPQTDFVGFVELDAFAVRTASEANPATAASSPAHATSESAASQ